MNMSCYNLIYYKPKLWERVVLFFCPLVQHESEGCIIWYKRFAKRMYIYGYIRSSGGEQVINDQYSGNAELN